MALPRTKYPGETDPEQRLKIEEQLKANQLKVVAATSALGMGFDKPDLAFVHPLPVTGLSRGLLPAGGSRRPRGRPRPGRLVVE